MNNLTVKTIIHGHREVLNSKMPNVKLNHIGPAYHDITEYEQLLLITLLKFILIILIVQNTKAQINKYKDCFHSQSIRLM